MTAKRIATKYSVVGKRKKGNLTPLTPIPANVTKLCSLVGIVGKSPRTQSQVASAANRIAAPKSQNLMIGFPNFLDLTLSMTVGT
jgi:hypothetical protein